MPIKLLALLSLVLARFAYSHELQEVAAGLDVSVEHLEGTLDVNGLPLAVSRAVGSAIPSLATRLIDRWRAESGKGSVHTEQCCGWQIANNIYEGKSRAIQWRSTSEGYELLWSSAELTKPIPIAPIPTVPLSAMCSWSAPVHGLVAGRRFMQISGGCKQDAATVLDLSAKRLDDEGWVWRRIGKNLIHAERGAVHAQLIATEDTTGNGRAPISSTLVVIESQPARLVTR